MFQYIIMFVSVGKNLIELTEFFLSKSDLLPMNSDIRRHTVVDPFWADVLQPSRYASGLGIAALHPWTLRT
jgi:hypothetical protein